MKLGSIITVQLRKMPFWLAKLKGIVLYTICSVLTFQSPVNKVEFVFKQFNLATTSTPGNSKSKIYMILMSNNWKYKWTCRTELVRIPARTGHACYGSTCKRLRLLASAFPQYPEPSPFVTLLRFLMLKMENPITNLRNQEWSGKQYIPPHTAFWNHCGCLWAHLLVLVGSQYE